MDSTKEQHQVLSKSLKKCGRDPGNDQTNVQGRKHEPCMECPNSPGTKKARQVKGKIKGFSTREFFTKNNTTIIPYPSYFSVFPCLKIKLNSRHFDTTEVIEAKSQMVLNTLIDHGFQDALKTMAEALGRLNKRGRIII
jgi:hypothetical protein